MSSISRMLRKEINILSGVRLTPWLEANIWTMSPAVTQCHPMSPNVIQSADTSRGSASTQGVPRRITAFPVTLNPFGSWGWVMAGAASCICSGRSITGWHGNMTHQEHRSKPITGSGYRPCRKAGQLQVLGFVPEMFQFLTVIGLICYWCYQFWFF